MKESFLLLLLCGSIIFLASKIFCFLEPKIPEPYSYKTDALLGSYLFFVVVFSVIGFYSLFSLLSAFFINVIV